MEKTSSYSLIRLRKKRPEQNQTMVILTRACNSFGFCRGGQLDWNEQKVFTA